jgi:hypothetical protein
LRGDPFGLGYSAPLQLATLSAGWRMVERDVAAGRDPQESIRRWCNGVVAVLDLGVVEARAHAAETRAHLVAAVDLLSTCACVPATEVLLADLHILEGRLRL